MFYETDTNKHGLAHDPFKAIVSPRPIGWIGTVSQDGTYNLAPYSFFNAIGDNPKLVMFSSNTRKDTVTNAEASGVFSASLASRFLAEKINLSSVNAPPDVSEFDFAGLEAAPGRLIAAPHVRQAFAALECKVVDIFTPKTLPGFKSGDLVVIGQVVGIHIDPQVVVDGKIDMAKAAPLARLGYRDFSDGSQTFEMVRPLWKDPDRKEQG